INVFICGSNLKRSHFSHKIIPLRIKSFIDANM
ncbi:hypothetical protein TorRG33x02_077780, partial [Trema orientale]